MIPSRDEFMDDDMRGFWAKLKGPLEGHLHLYGGTALALYLCHRESTDFDFVTTRGVVDIEFARRIPWLHGATLNGGPGMVDATIRGQNRELQITLMESGPMVPPPVRPPIASKNNVLVAHPYDLIIAKCIACVSRGASRDYFDLASAFEAWPRMGREAVKAVPGQPVARLAACLADPPPDAMKMLGKERVFALRKFSDSITPDYEFDNDPGPEP